MSRMQGIQRRLMMAGMAPLEQALTRGMGHTGPGPIFVIGLPRSGTTLLYEAIVTRWAVCYFPNLANTLYRTPAGATWMEQRVMRDWQGRFRSRGGFIAGRGAPNQGNRIWRMWLGDESEPTATTVPMVRIRRTIGAIEAMFGRPFVNKNVAHAVRLPAIAEVFPGAIFIDLQRDLSDSVRSLVRFHADRSDGSPTAIEPTTSTGEWSDDPVGDACRRLACIRADMEKSIASIGEDRRLSVRYESFCSDPEAELRRIGTFMRSAGIDLRDRLDTPIDVRANERRLLSPNLEDVLAANLERHEVPDPCETPSHAGASS